MGMTYDIYSSSDMLAGLSFSAKEQIKRQSANQWTESATRVGQVAKVNHWAARHRSGTDRLAARIRRPQPPESTNFRQVNSERCGQWNKWRTRQTEYDGQLRLKISPSRPRSPLKNATFGFLVVPGWPPWLTDPPADQKRERALNLSVRGSEPIGRSP